MPADASLAPTRPVIEPHRQIADAIVRTQDGRIEILLDPIELGRVTVTLGSDDGQGLGITAERPETLDLIRRHSDMLLRDLRDSGMPDARLDFLRQDSRTNEGTGGAMREHGGREGQASPGQQNHDQGQGQQQRQGHAQSPRAFAPGPAIAAPAPVAPPIARETRIDIRL